MTTKELEKKIKKLFDEFQHQQYKTAPEFLQWVESYGAKELKTLYFADNEFTYINKDAIKRIIIMNYSMKAIEFFGQHVRIR